MIRSYAKLPDRPTLALQALGWILADDARAQRFLSLTGLDPDQIRTGVGSPALGQAAFDHLLAHEPDLLAFADAVGVAPDRIADVARA